MFILRTLFWLGVVLLLLPVGRAENRDVDTTVSQDAAISAGQALSAAYSTVNDLSSFCNRNPDACAVGAAAIGALEAKAKDGVRVIYDWAAGTPDNTVREKPDQRSEKEAGLGSPGADAEVTITGTVQVAAGTKKASQNTLKLEDVIPEWSGPQSSDRA